MKNLITALLITTMPIASTSETNDRAMNIELTESNVNINYIATNDNPNVYWRVESSYGGAIDDDLYIYTSTYGRYLTLRQDNMGAFQWWADANNGGQSLYNKIKIIDVNLYNQAKINIQEIESSIALRINETYTNNVYQLKRNIIQSSNKQWAYYCNLQNNQITQEKWNEMIHLYAQDPYSNILDNNTENGTYNELNNIDNLIYDGDDNISKQTYIVIVENLALTENIDGNHINYRSSVLHVLDETIYLNGRYGQAPTQSIDKYEVVDIGGVILQIFTMPFAFISQAFNFTLFPNTPYQITISNIFLGIIVTLILVLLVKLIFKFFK